MGPVVAPHIRNIELCAFRLPLIAAPTLALKMGRLRIADLSDIPTLPIRRARSRTAVLPRHRGGGGRRGRGACLQLQFARDPSALIRDGVGVAVLPQVVLQEYLERGELRILDVDAQLPPLELSMSPRDNPGNACRADRRHGGGSRRRFHAEIVRSTLELRSCPRTAGIQGQRSGTRFRGTKRGGVDSILPAEAAAVGRAALIKQFLSKRTRISRLADGLAVLFCPVSRETLVKVSLVQNEHADDKSANLKSAKALIEKAVAEEQPDAGRACPEY